MRGGINFGDLSGISGLKADHELSSASDSSEDPDNEAKKLRLTDGLDEGSDDVDPLDLGSGEGQGEPVELHDEVPLEDPGPSGVGEEFSPGGTL